MEMGVNIGQPPGSGPAPGYPPAPSQPYYSSHGNEPCYQNQAPQPQQHGMYRGQVPPQQILSPNQGLPFHNKGIHGYPANQPQGIAMPAAPGQFSGLAKKGGYVSDCGAFNGPQNVLYSPNGLTRVQGTPQSGKFGGGPGSRPPRSNQPGSRGQFQGQMMFRGGPPPHQVMWFQNNSTQPLSSPPGGVHVSFPGNHGNPRMAMMSPTGVVGGPRGPGQMAQVRRMVMSPGAGQGVVMSVQGSQHMSSQHGAPTQRPNLHAVQQYGLSEHGQPRDASQQQQQHQLHQQPQQQAFHQHYQQQVHRHLIPNQRPAGAVGVQYSQPTVCTQQFSQQSLQNSPTIPYSQALQGYPSPELDTSDSSTLQSDSTAVPCQLPATVSSIQSPTAVYTMANSQAAHMTIASPQTIMSGSPQGTPTSSHSDTFSTRCSDTLNSSHSAEHSRNTCDNASGNTVSTKSSPNSEPSELTSADMEENSTSNNPTCDAKSNLTLTPDKDHSIPERTQPRCQQVGPETKPVVDPVSDHKSPNAAPSSSQSSRPSVLTIPFGWRRVAEKGTVVYYSPTQTRLSSLQSVVEYLTSDGTCKCGLSCPLHLETTFNFDLGVPARPWTVDCEVTTGESDLKRLCNHKRKLIAMAALQTSGGLNTAGQFGDMRQTASKVLEALSQGKKGHGKRKKSKSKLSGSPGDSAMLGSVPPEQDPAVHGLPHGPGAQPHFPSHQGPIAHHPFLHNPELKVATSFSGCDPIKVETRDLGPSGMEGIPSDVAKHQLQQQMMMGDHHPTDPRFRFAGPMHRPPQHYQPNMSMHRPQNPFEMLMGARQKMGHNPEQMPEGHAPSGLRQSPMNFGPHGGCMPPANQMFSLQLQMQAQAAAARNAGGARFGMTSPNMSSPSQHSSPSPGQFHLNKGGDLRSPPPFYDHSSPSPTMGPYRTRSLTPQTPGPHLLSPNSTNQPVQDLQQTSAGPDGPPPLKKKKKKKKKKDMNKALAGVLDKNMPCPNVDVRQFTQKHFPPHMAMGGPFQGTQLPMQSASFMENPAAFLAQQAEIMTSKIQSSLESEAQYMTPQGLPHGGYNKDSCMYHNAPNAALTSVEQTHRDLTSRCRSPVAAEDTLAGILSQESSQSRPSSRSAVESLHSEGDNTSQDLDGSSKDFPASCLLSARARLVQPCSVGRTSAMAETPLNSWSTSLRMNRFKVPSGPAPIRHVPPGGQQIGGGSIVYHHNIENQQAFQEGGIVNGGGILMVSTPANQSDSLYLNCIQNKPLFMQDPATRKNVQDVNPHHRIATSENQGHPHMLGMGGAHASQVLGSDPLKQQLTASPIQMVQNLISGIGNPGARAISHLARVSVSDVLPVNPAASVSETLLMSTLEQQQQTDSSSQPANVVNPPMPPLSVAAVTAVTNSITEVIPTVSSQTPSVSTTESSSSAHPVPSISPEKCQTHENAGQYCNNEESCTSTESRKENPKALFEVTDAASQEVRIVEAVSLTEQGAETLQSSANLESSHAQTTGTLKMKVVLKNAKKKKKKKKGKKVKVSRYVVEQSAHPDAIIGAVEDHVDVAASDPCTADSSEAKAEDRADDNLEDVDGTGDSTQEGQEAVIYSEGVQSSVLIEQQSQVLEQTSEQLVFPQGGAFPHQLIQGQDLTQVCITTQAQDQIAIAQGQATNLIQTVSFMPNMVGIDPNTGLVQSIQMPVASSPDGGQKIANAGVSEQVSPVAHTQVVQTVVQSLHIQNNVLVQGVAPAAGTFIQPLGAVGNALIPIFPGAGPVAPSSESAVSLMAMNSAVSISSGGQISPYLESPRPSSNVVSTQTEAVQTEDSCSDLLDSEGGGRLLVDNEGILADEDDLQETLELAGQDDEQEGGYRTSGDYGTTAESHPEETFGPTTSEALERLGITKQSSGINQNKNVCNSATDTVDNTQREEIDAKSTLRSKECAEPQFAETSVSKGSVKQDLPDIHIDRSTSESGESNTSELSTEDELKHSNVDNTSEDKITSPSKDHQPLSYLSVPVTFSDLSQSSLSDSQSMPILSREGSAKDLSTDHDAERKKMLPALAVLHKHLEENFRMHQDEVDFREDASKEIDGQSIESSEKSVKLMTQEVVREKSEDPPALSVIDHIDNPIKGRGARIKKNRRTRLHQKSKKILRASLRLNNTHIKSYPESPRANKSPVRKELSINNNKSPEISHTEDPFPQTQAPSPTLPHDDLKLKAPTLAGPKQAFIPAEGGDTQEQKSGSVGGSSDGEANQSSDSSQSVVSSEGDEVRHGNSPSIRCSNLLTSSPETNDLNCTSHGGFEKRTADLDGKVFTEGAKNHVRSGSVHMKTRRSIRSELENVLPRRAAKRAAVDNVKHNELEVERLLKPSVDPPLKKSFQVGELIWGPIKNFPSWPGKLVPHSDVPRSPTSEPDKLWVRWFGMHTHSQVEPSLLKTLSEGLEAHHSACLKQRKGRKMNPNLESAIEEAMQEFDRPIEPVTAPADPAQPVPAKVAKVKKVLKKKKAK